MADFKSCSKALPDSKTHTLHLNKTRKFLTYGSLAFAMFTVFIDTTSVTTTLPTISRGLDAADTIFWIGTSYQIANTIFQVLYGRLADIFGRKPIYLFSLACVGLGDLCCGFARTGLELYLARALSGIGGGGVTCLTMILVSDMVTLEERGKYQGILGAAIGVGSAVGPFLGGQLSERGMWRWTFFSVVPMISIAALLALIFIPKSSPPESITSKLAKIDYLGMLSSSASILCNLVALSGGGTTYAWNSPMVVALLTVGVAFSVLFIIVEVTFAKYPMVCFRLLRDRSVLILMLQNLLTGTVQFANQYYLPIYLQSVRLFTPTQAAALMLPFTVCQSTSSVVVGLLMTRFAAYKPFVIIGFASWTLGVGLQILFTKDIPVYGVIFVLGLGGIGLGSTLQPTLVAAQANCAHADRAVVTSMRNLFRQFSGAVGLSISSTLFKNTYMAAFDALELDDNTRLLISTQTFDIEVLPASPDIQHQAAMALAQSIKTVFVFFTPLLTLCFVASWFIRGKSLKTPTISATSSHTYIMEAQIVKDTERPVDSQTGP